MKKIICQCDVKKIICQCDVKKIICQCDVKKIMSVWCQENYLSVWRQVPKLYPAVALSHQDGRHSAIALLLKAALIQVSVQDGFYVNFPYGPMLN
jgi:hypothetical protein